MYLIDTNICIYLMKRNPVSLVKYVESKEPFSIYISAISVAELECGSSKSRDPETNRMALYEFLSSFEILPFSVGDGMAFGDIRHYLQARGTPIGPYDMLIAAQCLTNDLVLVTNNTKEFDRVPSLKLENWVNNED